MYSAQFENVIRLVCGTLTAYPRQLFMAAIRRHSADPDYGSENARSTYERQMGERLREIAELTAAFIQFLGEQA